MVLAGMALLVSLVLLTVSCHKEKVTNNQNNTDTEVPGGDEDPGDNPGGGDSGGGGETGDHVISNGVTDADGNQYNTVVLGNQEWMAENLRVTHYADGTAIPMGTDGQWSDTDPYRYTCIYIQNTAASNMTITNSTFANIDATAVSAGIIDTKAATGTVVVDHCTFYDCKAKNTDYGVIGHNGSFTSDFTVSNSIFAWA